ncbi:unnamed protein product [Periconia digitata]|uniref:Zn(2)-C6 fungal-type domain-containing protein n=1 Tax=Periconia digitata TaxID=1303443 RepID=A0A9W4UEX0_9PLEO|nr:unnamed protein product [Periconia digitata]
MMQLAIPLSYLMSDPPLGPPRVAIPRLERRGGDYRPAPTRNATKRVTKACVDCRTRKIRCSGEIPKCQNCITHGLICTYPQARTDRLKSATSHVAQLVDLLKDLSVQVDEEGQKKIDQIMLSLEGNSATASTKPVLSQQRPNKRSRSTAESLDGDSEADVSSSVASNDNLYYVDEDLFLNRESRATGFIGQNSVLQWFRSLKLDIGRLESTDPTNRTYSDASGQSLGRDTFIGDISRVSSSTFYLDSDEVESDSMADPWILPEPEIAEALFHTYLQTVHPSFPLLPSTFEVDFRKFHTSAIQGRRYPLTDCWKATLNLVFAIGAQHSHLAQSPWRSEKLDHVSYSTRAVRLLCLDRMITAMKAPSLEAIQATGLLSLYYLMTGQVNRAWMVIGVSLRFSLGVGLHLRNDDTSTSSNTKNDMSRTWWTLNSIEVLLCVMTGRPRAISSEQCTAPRPSVNLDVSVRQDSTVLLQDQIQDQTWDIRSPAKSVLQETITSSLYRASFTATSIDLDIVIEDIISCLYPSHESGRTWRSVEKKIEASLNQLQNCIAEPLPQDYRSLALIDPSFQREQLLLSFQYHSVKLLIHRSYLSRLHSRSKVDGHSTESVEKALNTCFDAAVALTNLFPDQPDLTFIYQRSPWWCITHIAMQATAVFLLQLSIGGGNTPRDDTARHGVRKLLSWLKHMGSSNAVAERAFELVVDIVVTGASTLKIEISDIIDGANYDQSQSFHVSGWSMNEALLISPGMSPLKPETARSDTYPTTAATMNDHYPPNLWNSHDVQGTYNLPPNQYNMPVSTGGVPPVFSNPFAPDYGIFNTPENWGFQDGQTRNSSA